MASKWEEEKKKRQQSMAPINNAPTLKNEEKLSKSKWELEKEKRSYVDNSAAARNSIAKQEILDYASKPQGVPSAVKSVVDKRPVFKSQEAYGAVPKPLNLPTQTAIKPTASSKPFDNKKPFLESRVEPVKTEIRKPVDVSGIKPNLNETIQQWNPTIGERFTSSMDKLRGANQPPAFKQEETRIQDATFVPQYDMTNKIDHIKAKFKIGQISDTEGVEWNKVAEGNKSAYAQKASDAMTEMYTRYPKLFDEVKLEDPTLWNKAVSFIGGVPEAVAQMLPTMLNAMKDGAIVGGAGAAAGAGTALALGQLGPQVALPEEVISVPGAAATGFKMGAALGSGAHMYQVEKGLSYKTMMDEGVDPNTANRWATVVGLANAGIEVAQMGEILKAAKATGFDNTVLKPFASGLLNKFLNNKGLAVLAKFSKGVAIETGQELAQEAISITGETGAMNQSGIKRELFSTENGQRMLDTAISSAQAFVGLQGASQIAGGTYRSLTKRSTKEKIADRQNIESVIKAVEAAPLEVDTNEVLAAKLDDLEAIVVESISNPEMAPHEVEWAQSTVERIQRAKVGRGMGTLEQKPQQSAVSDPSDNLDDTEPNIIYTSKYGFVEVLDSNDATVELKNDKGTKLSVGRKAFEAMISDTADEPAVKGVVENQIQAPSIPEKLQRYEEIDAEESTVNKPQGLYASPSNIESPHKDLGGKKYEYDVNPNANILSIETDTFDSNRGIRVGESAGIAVARKLIGDDEVTRMMKSNKQRLVDSLSIDYPDVEWNRYHDQHEMIEGVAGILARQEGYDGIWAYDKGDPNDVTNEFVALNKNAFLPKETEKQQIVYEKETETNDAADIEKGINNTTALTYKENTNSLAELVRTKLNENSTISATEVFKIADSVFGGSQAKGTYTVKDAYDSLELAVNLHILNDMDEVDIKSMQKLLDLLPTQNKRTSEMEQYQQFSTPPSIAYVAAWVANIDKTDIMLEPSAGIGGLALFAKKNGAKVFVNEFSARRLDVLKNMPFDGFFNENAEQLDNILPDNIKPSVIIMNPPFSATAGRMADKNSTKYAKMHIEQALERLQPNGRLVAIVGQGMAHGTPTFNAWWKELESKYNVRANIGINGKNYVKYGTSFDIQMFVIDKTGPTTTAVLTGKVDKLEELQTMLEAIKNDRTRTEQETIIVDNKKSDEVTKNRDGDGSIISPTSVSVDIEGDGLSDTKRQASDDRPSGVNVDLGTAESVGLADKRTDRTGDTISNQQGDGKPSDTMGADGSVQYEPSGISLEVEVKSKKEKKSTDSEVEADDDIYSNYVPMKLKIKNAVNHVTMLVESAAMATVAPPDPTYSPKLNKGIVENGDLSLAQLENVVYAGQAHAQMLLSGFRRGYFIGDGTGVGKGRQIAGIIQDNFNNGRKKAVWISKGFNLLEDAERDWVALGGKKEDVISMKKINAKTGAINQKTGILFAGYSTLGSSENRLKQLVNWLGADFDGVIAFDEAHGMGNALDTKGARGTSKASAKAKACMELQRLLPNARVVYVTATAATDVSQFAYANRLGLWGDGTAFRDVQDFIGNITTGGLAAMELMARDMKSLGLYLARNLSFKGVEYDTLLHNLTSPQVEMYDKAAEAWQIVLKNIDVALEATGQNKDGRARASASSQFWGSNQRFFNQVMTSMSVPSLISAIKSDLARGESVVIQLVNTNEAAQKRSLADSEEAGVELEDLDMSPTDILVGYLNKSFPIHQFESYIDDDGNEKSRQVLDSKGNPVINKAALRLRDDLIADVKMMKMPNGPIDMLIDEFGTDVVSEVTGRSKRLVWKVNEKTGKRERVVESWGAIKSSADVDNFQNGAKRILIFSGAGATGKSYHADKNAKNQTKRNHYLFQPGWNAIEATQGLGRTHRNNQVSTPKFILVTTDLKGQKRFVSTIARRLNQMGAITKGQRQTGSGMFSEKDNLEGPLASDVLVQFYRDLYNDRIGGIDGADILTKMGLSKAFRDSKGSYKEDPDVVSNIPRFLNRLINLNTTDQNVVFEAFSEMYENAVNAAIKAGTLDTGLENYKAQLIETVDKKIIRKDELTGAETEYIQLNATKSTLFRMYERTINADNFVKLVRINSTGELRAVLNTSSVVNSQSGEVTKQYRLSAVTAQTNDNMFIQKTMDNLTVDIPKSEWKKAWAAEVKKTPETYIETLHMLTGTLLPIWNKLPKDRTRVIRVTDNKGNSYLGRIIAKDQIDGILKKFDISRTKESVDGAKLFNAILNQNKTAFFNQGTKLMRRKISGEHRIEIMGPNAWQVGRAMEGAGAFQETIAYNRRFFIPTAEATSIRVLNEFLKRNEFVDFEQGDEELDVPDYLKGDTAPSQKMGIVHQSFQKPMPLHEKLTFADFEANNESVEDAHRRNIITPEKVHQKIAAWGTEMKHAATRTFRELDENNPFLAEFRKEMINYKKLTHQARFKATMMLKHIVLPDGHKLTKEEYNRFERYVFLRDLMEDFKEERSLPYPYTIYNIQPLFDLTKRSLNENINNAVLQRDQQLERVKNDYIKAMGKIGFNVSNRFTKENYFRHQVLEYYNTKDALTGSGSRVKVNTQRGQLKQRHGTELSINENYLQAEYEILFNMTYDTSVAEMLQRVRVGYDITKKLKAEAKKLNKIGFEAIVKQELEIELEKAGESVGILDRYTYKDLKQEFGIESASAETFNKFNQKIAMNFSYIQKMAKNDELWDDNGKWSKVVAALKSGVKDESDKTMAYIAELASSEEEGMLNALGILKAISQREQFVKTSLGEQYYGWKNGIDNRLVPEDYSKWQPIQGKHMMMVNSVTDQMSEVIIKMQLGESIKDIALKQSDLKINNMLAYAGDRMTYIIPTPAANTLDSVYSNMTSEVASFKQVWGGANNAFKIWVLLLNPHQVVKYNLRNVSGDLEAAVYTAGFNALAYTDRSCKEVYNMMRYGQFTPELLEFFNRGGLESNIIAQEIADVNKLKIFENFRNRTRLEKAIAIPKTYKEFSENVSTYRETIMRYAVYLHFKDALRKGGGKLDFYGGSNRNIIIGLKSIEDKAFQMANDALGAYDQVTEMGQAIRKYMIPFYSFTEINYKRMFNVLKNAKNLESINEALGKSINLKLKLGLAGKAVAKLGWIMLRITFLTVLLNLWNRIVKQDDDDKLPESARRSPHLTLGHNDKGEIIYFTRLGTLSDLLEWFGLDTLVDDVNDLNMDRKSWKQQINDMAVSPLNKLVNSLSPFIKAPVELLTKRSFFPDITEPSTIRDGLGYLAQSLGLKEEYSRLAGLPANKTYAESWINAFIYTANPGQTAYYRVLDLKQSFEYNQLGKFKTSTFSDSPKSDALYKMKLSIKYGDDEKARKYLLKYVENGGTGQGLSTSLESMNPIYGLDPNEAEAFMMYLTPRERQDVKAAIEWYLELFNQ